MSVVFVQQQTKNKNSPPSHATIQKMLDENHQLIQTIADFQYKGCVNESTQYQQMLHRNLVYLATIADANTNIQALLPLPGQMGVQQNRFPSPNQMMRLPTQQGMTNYQQPFGMANHQQQPPSMINSPSQMTGQQHLTAAVGQNPQGMITQNPQGLKGQHHQGIMSQNPQSMLVQNPQGMTGHNNKGMIDQNHQGMIGQSHHGFIGESQQAMVGHSQQGIMGHDQSVLLGQSQQGMIVQNEQEMMRQKQQGMIAQNEQDVMRQNQQGTISHGQDLVGQCHPGIMGQNVPCVTGVNQSVMIQHNQQGMLGHSQPGAMGQGLPTVVTQNLPGMISHGQQKVGSENVTEQQGQNAMANNQNVSNHKQFSLTGQQSPAVMASHPGDVMRQHSSNQAHIGRMQANQPTTPSNESSRSPGPGPVQNLPQSHNSLGAPGIHSPGGIAMSHIPQHQQQAMLISQQHSSMMKSQGPFFYQQQSLSTHNQLMMQHSPSPQTPAMMSAHLAPGMSSQPEVFPNQQQLQQAGMQSQPTCMASLQSAHEQQSPILPSQQSVGVNSHVQHSMMPLPQQQDSGMFLSQSGMNQPQQQQQHGMMGQQQSSVLLVPPQSGNQVLTDSHRPQQTVQMIAGGMPIGGYQQNSLHGGNGQFGQQMPYQQGFGSQQQFQQASNPQLHNAVLTNCTVAGGGIGLSGPSSFPAGQAMYIHQQHDLSGYGGQGPAQQQQQQQAGPAGPHKYGAYSQQQGSIPALMGQSVDNPMGPGTQLGGVGPSGQVAVPGSSGLMPSQPCQNYGYTQNQY